MCKHRLHIVSDAKQIKKTLKKYHYKNCFIIIYYYYIIIIIATAVG